jgi:hypothetical protein
MKDANKQTFLVTTKSGKYLCVKGFFCWKVKRTTKKIKFSEVLSVVRL